MRYCEKCGKEVKDTAAKCEACGAPLAKMKRKKPIFKRWWFWSIIVLVIIAIAGNSNDSETKVPADNPTDIEASSKVDTTPVMHVYEEVDLQTMLDELNANALKAEKTYQNKLVTVTGKIANFDSDGSYISIEPVAADVWNFSTVMCKIKDKAHLDILLELVVGDVVTIKGEVTDIGELMGYTIEIMEIE